jgi:hypothetical protein
MLIVTFVLPILFFITPRVPSLSVMISPMKQFLISLSSSTALTETVLNSSDKHQRHPSSASMIIVPRPGPASFNLL